MNDKIAKKKDELDRIADRKSNTEKKWLDVHSRHQSLQVQIQMKNSREQASINIISAERSKDGGNNILGIQAD